MSGRPLRILCTGDLHVGRRPSRVVGCAEPRRVSCAAMLADLVDYAIAQKIDALAISGDIVDRENRFYEAYGPLERNLRRLTGADIDTFVVSGNHDFDVLPRLAHDLGSQRFHFLGSGGAWEQQALRRDGAMLNILGWSFPAERVLDNPLRTCPPPSSGQAPTLGLLHADLDQPQSAYAPVALSELQRLPVALWVLGHIHRPRFYRQDGLPPVLYPGSPQAMDPGETGPHGPWIVEIDARGDVAARHIPLSRVRYDQIEIDLTGIDTKESFESHVTGQLKRELAKACAEGGPLEYCCCRLHLAGRTRLHRKLAGLCDALQQDLELNIGEVLARIDCVIIETRPPLDLQALARGNDVPGELARLLLELSANTPGPDALHLLAQLAQRSADLCDARAYQQLADPPPEPAACRQALLRQGMLMLDALLAQKEGT